MQGRKCQQPLEILDALLTFVASELAIDPTTIQAYAQQRQTISAHQEHVRLHLGFRPFGPTERESLSACVFDEAAHLQHTSALLVRAEEFLRDHQILIPAVSMLRRLVSEQQERARHTLFARMMGLLPTDMQARLEALLHVEAEHRVSPLQLLKEPPSLPSPRACPA